MSDKILTILHDEVLEITLNNPAKLNCMGFEMLSSLQESIHNAAKDKKVKVIVFRGAGEKSFSTGADLKEFNGLNEQEVAQWIRLGHELFNEIEALEKPTIAFINGYAMGGGLELALACDFRVAVESAIFSCPELQHGWLPGWGGMVRLTRIVGELRAKEMVMLNWKKTASESLAIGLINAIEKNDGSVLLEIKEHLKSVDGEMFYSAKKVIRDQGRSTNEGDILFDIDAALRAKHRLSNQ